MNDPDFKERLFERIFTKNTFKVGDRIRVVNTSKRGVITAINSKLDEVVWVNNTPHFIEITLDDGEMSVANMMQITRKRV